MKCNYAMLPGIVELLYIGTLLLFPTEGLTFELCVFAKHICGAFRRQILNPENIFFKAFKLLMFEMLKKCCLQPFLDSVFFRNHNFKEEFW